jgi:hypothetical protein
VDEYQGEHAGYVLLVALADRLLRPYGLSDASSSAIPPSILTALGLQQDQILVALQSVINARPGLEQLALQLAA